MLEIEVARTAWPILESRIASRERLRDWEVGLTEVLWILRLEWITEVVALLLLVQLLLMLLQLLHLLLQSSILLLDRVTNDLCDCLFVHFDLIWVREGKTLSSTC